ncbi:hypothetical protein CRE_29125 [Caenorhabditis remanei]|uniref:Uncharacterized protein n=1 Tax=Caenorhabditis remanei TaxID=31234 RepID=E3N4N3_CAERE|nr:hypothetical protein CRE_29125 [Caenorhabditis remanei]
MGIKNRKKDHFELATGERQATSFWLEVNTMYYILDFCEAWDFLHLVFEGHQGNGYGSKLESAFPRLLAFEMERQELEDLDLIIL